MRNILLIGSGAIGSVVLRDFVDDPAICMRWVMDMPARRESLQRELGERGKAICALDELDARPDFVVECAGHAAVKTHVPQLLEQGIDVILVSIGSLAEPGIAEMLEAAARKGGAQLTLISGAIAAIDAIASARVGGLDEVIYTGRKPPLGWQGTPAEKVVDLASLTAPAVLFEGSAGEAARLYPKNANVAATVSLAGLGLERTRATLIADPGVTKNIHRVQVRGTFGELDLTISGNPLPDNPKTSALTAYSAIRAIRNRVAPLVI
jgi:aspartate dehydrogenase